MWRAGGSLGVLCVGPWLARVAGHGCEAAKSGLACRCKTTLRSWADCSAGLQPARVRVEGDLGLCPRLGLPRAFSPQGELVSWVTWALPQAGVARTLGPFGLRELGDMGFAPGSGGAELTFCQPMRVSDRGFPLRKAFRGMWPARPVMIARDGGIGHADGYGAIGFAVAGRADGWGDGVAWAAVASAGAGAGDGVAGAVAVSAAVETAGGGGGDGSGDATAALNHGAVFLFRRGWEW